MNQIRIGTRKSILAMAQANKVANIISSRYHIDIKIIPIITSGDKILDKALYEIGGKSLFVKELEEALINGEIDIAVHSLKDIPAQMMPDLKIGAVLEREDPRDAIVSANGYNLATLPIHAHVGTCSTRRKIQLLKLRPDLKILDCRGNIDTRISKMKNGEFDAIMLAKVGLDRLNLQVPACAIDTDIIPPAPCQAVLALQIHTQNITASEICKALNHQLTWQIIQAERGFVETLNASCRTPVAAFASLNASGMICTNYMLSNFEGTKYFIESSICKIQDAYKTASAVAKNMLNKFL